MPSGQLIYIENKSSLNYQPHPSYLYALYQSLMKGWFNDGTKRYVQFIHSPVSRRQRFFSSFDVL